jgi:maltooligosyltrehalose trehalohydrolase
MTSATHAMPFGAAAHADGSVRFRLWAPDAQRVDLCIGEGDTFRALEMPAGDDGWFALTTADAAAGSRYRYRIDGEIDVPDPASRFQPEGVGGPSEVIDPAGYRWRHARHGRPWEEAVVYELHIGTFTPAGTFESASQRLPYLADLGITAVEIMPVATFPGARNWGYDGVLPYAPHPAYGRPEQFRSFVDAAHSLGLMVLLDVVYNHFGPEGNWLHAYASPFFTDRHQTPWGDAINFDGRHSRTVRDFFIHNALHWLEEYRLDGLRLDAVHAIADDSAPDILEELADAVQTGPGRSRPIHLVLENYDNEARYLGRKAGHYAAQWNDDFHHACHTLLTGESDGYYADYANRPLAHLARCLAEGFAYQGEPSAFHGGTPRGEPSGDLPLTAFINFLQNHDQVGNRAFGERLAALAPAQPLRAITSILLMSPAVPALFMGEEFGCTQPFLYFADFEGELAEAVRNGRRREFASFETFGGAELPDPISPETFEASVIAWEAVEEAPHAEWLAFHRGLLELRRQHVVPGLPARAVTAVGFPGKAGLLVTWRLADGSLLTLLANLGEHTVAIDGGSRPRGRCLQAVPPDAAVGEGGELPPWSALWLLDDGT